MDMNLECGAGAAVSREIPAAAPATDWVKTFGNEGTWQAMYAAEKFLEQRGFSVASTQGPAPRGVLLGEWDIAKWRNLTRREREALDGVMTGDMRNGPVTVRLYAKGRADNVAAALAAVAREPA